MDYDFIVVGAGTAGCVLAARLSENPAAQVLLLEAGSAARTRAMTVPNAWPDNIGTDADWGNSTTAQAEAGPAPYPRGRALGGSSAINAMAHVRGHQVVYDDWAASGADGWAFADLLPYFRRTEHAADRDPALRGTAGPVRVAPVPAGERHPVAIAFAEALGTFLPATDDLSGQQQEGICWADLAISGGERVSAADAYLRPALTRPNLTVGTGCVATGLRIRSGRCAGVRYTREGRPDEARTAGEVILTAGAIGSPQLLMLSGIGAARRLRDDLGIAVTADLPAVGENLQDHPVAMACFATPSPLPPSRYNHGEVYATVRSEYAGDWPDLQLFTILLPVAPPHHTAPSPGGFALVASVVAPDSRGTVRLPSAAPGAAPLIDPGFLSAGRDLDRLSAGLEVVRYAGSRRELAGIGGELWPGPADRSLRRYIRRTVGSYYHPAGTCRMGSDPSSVVDNDLRVRGIAGLRVADASVMPVIPNAHPNATVLAIAERAAELIAAAH